MFALATDWHTSTTVPKTRPMSERFALLHIRGAAWYVSLHMPPRANASRRVYHPVPQSPLDHVHQRSNRRIVAPIATANTSSRKGRARKNTRTFRCSCAAHAVEVSPSVRARSAARRIPFRKSWKLSRCTIAATRLKRPQKKSHRGTATRSRPRPSRDGSPSIPRSPPIAASATATGDCFRRRRSFARTSFIIVRCTSSRTIVRSSRF